MRKIAFSMIVLLLLAGMFQPAAAQTEGDLSVTITASSSMQRLYGWNVNVFPEGTWLEFVVTEGYERDLLYHIEATRQGFIDEAELSGEVCVTNNTSLPVSDFTITVYAGEGSAQHASMDVDSTENPEINLGEQVCYPWHMDITTWFQPGGTYYAEAHVTSAQSVYASTQTSGEIPSEPQDVLYESITVIIDGSQTWTFSDTGSEKFRKTYTCEDVGHNATSVEVVETGLTYETYLDIYCSNCVQNSSYWKNHTSTSRNGYDEAWAIIGEDTPFKGSELTWGEMMAVPTKGDVFYKLAKEYIAANLNIANGVVEDWWINRITRNAGMALSIYFNEPGSDGFKESAPGLTKALQEINNGKWQPVRCTGKP